MRYAEISKIALDHGISNGLVYIAQTDKLIFEKYPLKDTVYINDDNLLECRIFNEKGELKAIRISLSAKWHIRYIDDQDKDMIKDKHYLDIDTTKCIKCEDDTFDVQTTRGGKFHLPYESINDVQIIIHNYIRYTDDGHAYIYDYRYVKLTGN